MTTWLLCISHALAGGVGYALCYFGVVKMGTRRAQRRAQREAHTMPNRRTPWLPIILLVASAMVVSIGAMSYLDRRDSDEQARQQAAEQARYDQCITEWGDALVLTITNRNAARVAYDNAAKARGDATAVVLGVSLQLVLTPPRAELADLQRALVRARNADRALSAAATELETTQQENAYKTPTLACASERNDP